MNMQVTHTENNEALEQQKGKQRRDELDAKLNKVITELRPLQDKTWNDYDDIIADIESNDSAIVGPAQFELGCRNGNAGYNFEASAEAGYVPGQYATARICEMGVSENDFFIREHRNSPDLLAAIYWYGKAEKQDFPLAKGKVGQLLEQLRKNAEAGDPDATYDMAACYETGVLGLVEKDTTIAVVWYEKSARAGNPIAHLSLGEIYYFGAYGIDRDEEAALGHFSNYILWFFSEAPQLPLCVQRCTEMLMFAGLGFESSLQSAIFNLAVLLFEIQDTNLLDLIIVGFSNARVYGVADEDGEIERNSDTGWQNRLVTAIYHYTKTKDLKKFRDDLLGLLFYSDEAEVSAVGESDDVQDDPTFNLTLRTGVVGLGHIGGLRNFIERKPGDPGLLRCRHIEAVLREIAGKGVIEARLLLGLILVNSYSAGSPEANEGKGWIEDGVKENDILSCLWYASLGRRGLIQCGQEEVKIALKRVIYADFDEVSRLKKRSELKPRQYKGEIFTPEYCQILRQRAEHQLADIEREEAELRAKEQAQRDMLSYLTHTLNNTLSSGPEAARQAMRILGSELYENNREYKAINNIASMFSTFLFAQQLLKTFKLYIADPDLLRQNWVGDTEGDASITVVMALALRQTLSQLVFSANHQAALQRLLPHKEAGAIKVTRKSFMEEIVPLDVDAENTAVLFDWVESHLGAVTISIDPAAELHFRSNSTRFTFFFSSFSELIYNALKYSDGTQPIEAAWEKSGESFVFRCRNTWTEDSLQSSEGSGKGLLFLTRLVDMLGASLTTQRGGGVFVAEIRFPEKLIKGA